MLYQSASLLDGLGWIVFVVKAYETDFPSAHTS